MLNGLLFHFLNVLSETFRDIYYGLCYRGPIASVIRNRVLGNRAIGGPTVLVIVLILVSVVIISDTVCDLRLLDSGLKKQYFSFHEKMFLKWTFYLVCFFIIKTNGQESPCPNIFNYVNEGYQNYGIIKIPSLYFGQSISLVVQMSLGTYSPIVSFFVFFIYLFKKNHNFIFLKNYTGKIEVLGEKEEVAWNMVNGDLIVYKVNFPLSSPVPRITSIIINNVQYCSGLPGKHFIIHIYVLMCYLSIF